MRRITPAAIKRRARRYILAVAKLSGAVARDTQFEPFPAGFRRWVDRRSSKIKNDIPKGWHAVPPITGPYPRVAVVMHVFYLDLVEEILRNLRNIPVEFDLLVTNSSGSPCVLDTSAISTLREVRVFALENHGRDILPLVHLVNAGMIDPYELVLKVHTKKSVWRETHEGLAGSGESWREGFLTELIGDRATTESILSRFASEPTLGLLTSRDNILDEAFWGGDEEKTRHLLRRIQLDLDSTTLTFAAGSIYWVKGFVLQGLRSLDLSAVDFEPELGQVDGTTAHAIERAIGILTEESGYELDIPAGHESLSGTDAVGSAWLRYSPSTPVRPFARAIPFFLPQFHTFPQNDLWWGKGFTEWSNVAAAKPSYLGHVQPLLPGELGFYDLTNEQARRAQGELASAASLEGFMYYYYWFAGKKLMDLPLEAHVSSTSPGKFCIMWANENWTRTWDGGDEDILIGQDYDHVPATQFIHDVIHLLTDDRYLTVGGLPLIAIYRVTQIPDFAEVVDYWRKVAVEAGLPGLEVLTVDVGAGMDGIEGDSKSHGLDGYLEFAPHNMCWSAQSTDMLELDSKFAGRVMNYGAMADAAIRKNLDAMAENRFPGVMVSFDNTARRQWKPDMWYGTNPYTYRRWLRSAAESVGDRDHDRRIVFINAWNEWAESAVLEPTQRYGKTYLLATRDALNM